MSSIKRKILNPSLPDLKEGQRFGYLTVQHKVEQEYNNGRNSQRYLCLCDCGNEIVLGRSSLLNGNRKSCGCRSPHAAKKDSPITLSSVYSQWTKIKEQPHDEAWDSFTAFKQWSIQHGCVPHAKMVLLNNATYYGPKTCAWLSGEALEKYKDNIRRIKRRRSCQTYWNKAQPLKRIKNQENRSALIPYKGYTARTVPEWAVLLQMPKITLYKRMAFAESGTLEEALQAPYKGRDLVAELDEYFLSHPNEEGGGD